MDDKTQEKISRLKAILKLYRGNYEKDLTEYGKGYAKGLEDAINIVEKGSP